MKTKLKQEFGVFEDGNLRKLLSVGYEWKDIEDKNKARVIVNMEDKAQEIIRAYKKATGTTPRVQKTPGKPGEFLDKHEGEPIKYTEYRSILGKLTFYVSKVSPECKAYTQSGITTLQRYEKMVEQGIWLKRTNMN